MKKESFFLRFLYHTFLGRIFLKLLTHKSISKFLGFILDTRFSYIFIKNFAKKNNIKLDDYYNDYSSFNAFFSRKIHEELRPIINDKNILISPSDGYLSAYKIEDGLIIPIKQSQYSISSLLQNSKLSSLYKDGICLVIRLGVDNYHRYCYVDNGKKEKNIFIPGKLHTIRPIALEKYPVFIQNSREYTILNTKNFGKIVEIEVGALLVGKIKNYHEVYNFKKGEEKGKFLYGGSTIILLIQKDKVKIPDKYFIKTNNGEEIPVKMGEKIGEKN